MGREVVSGPPVPSHGCVSHRKGHVAREAGEMVGGEGRQRMKHVYFMQAASGGPIKIGISADVEARRSQIQSSHSERVIVLATKPGGELDEISLHRRLTRHRLKGEWFEDCPEVRAEIASAAPYEAPERAARPRRGRHLTADEVFMLDSFGDTLRNVFGEVPDAYRAIAHAAGVTQVTAKNWLRKKTLPQTVHLVTFARNHPTIKAWFMVMSAAMSLRVERGSTLEEAYDYAVQDKIAVIRFWFGEDHARVAMGGAP